ncbi:MAG: rod-binding protein [Treponema sp.]|nr:rod-binding protein [Treponema sp.]
MDINFLRLQQLQNINSANLPFATAPSLQAPGQNAESGFADLLRRAQNAGASGDGEASSQAPRPPGIPAIVQNKELFEAALELETLLVQNLIRGMRNTIQRTNLIDTGFAGQIYEDMLFDEYARLVTRNAGFGFAEMAYRELAGHGPRRA